MGQTMSERYLKQAGVLEARAAKAPKARPGIFRWMTKKFGGNEVRVGQIGLQITVVLALITALATILGASWQALFVLFGLIIAVLQYLVRPATEATCTLKATVLRQRAAEMAQVPG